ncbi:MAG: DUF4105 domain-containing protein [Elusimicrobiota bacterium]|nr:DUF4105 domain-containing protein [Elusimicrobiota bacterium]
MTKEKSKAVLAAGLVFLLGSLNAKAAEPFTLNSLSAVKISKLDLSIPLTGVPPADAGLLSPAAAGSEDGPAGSLTPAEWDEIFASGPEAKPGDTKELLSDFSSRYVMNGTLQLDRVPRTFTTLEGKVYKLVKYPKWLRNTGNTEFCVEGYIRQQDNTSELAIATVLPLDAAAAYAPSAATLDLQRQSYILSKDSRGYALANVNWGVQHSADGKRLKRADGIFKFIWPKSVTVKPDFLEQAYVGKKSLQSFPYAGVHGFLAFKFKPGGVTDGNGNSVRGLVVSVNTYSLVPGVQNQGIIDGLRGRYAVHYNINSAEGYVEQNVFTDGNRISLYPLTLSRDRQVKLLENAIRQATANRTGEMYSLIYNSCTNAVVSFINGVLNKNEKIVEGWLPEIIYRLRATLPDAATRLLTRRGLVSKPLPYLDETNYTQLFHE